MNIKIQTDCININWQEVRNIVKTVGMSYVDAEIHKKSFENIISQAPSCNFILYSSPEKKGFYESLGFRKLSTGMGLFYDMERTKNRGFIK